MSIWIWAAILVAVLAAAGVGTYLWRERAKRALPRAVVGPPAIDTTEKLLSLLNFNTPFLFILPEADGSIDAGDRLHLLNLYSGIAAQVVGAVPWFWSGWREPA